MWIVFEYKNVEDIVIIFFVYDFKIDKWLDFEIVFRRILLGVMYFGVKLVVG